MTLEQAKEYLNISPTDDVHDDKVTDMIDGSVERVEHDCERVLITQTFEAYGDCFPLANDGIMLDRYPVQSVASVEYIDTDAATQTLDPANYAFDKARRAVFPAIDFQWPSVTPSYKSVTVTFDAGSGADGSTVPADLIQGVLLLVSNRFYGLDNLEAYEQLIKPYKRTRYP